MHRSGCCDWGRQKLAPACTVNSLRVQRSPHGWRIGKSEPAGTARGGPGAAAAPHTASGAPACHRSGQHLHSTGSPQVPCTCRRPLQQQARWNFQGWQAASVQQSHPEACFQLQAPPARGRQDQGSHSCMCLTAESSSGMLSAAGTTRTGQAGSGLPQLHVPHSRVNFRYAFSCRHHPHRAGRIKAPTAACASQQSQLQACFQLQAPPAQGKQDHDSQSCMCLVG